MLDGNTNERASIGELYSTAVNGSSLRVGNDHTVRTAGDVLAAAGMNSHRTGLALMRLVTEWESGAVPALAGVPEVKALAQQMAAQRVEEDIRCEHTDRGLTVSQKQAMRAATKVQKSDIDLAHAESKRLQARATNWNHQENMLRFQRLKTLPAIRAGLLFYVQERDWEDGEHLVAAVLRRFLSPVCPVCAGRKRNVIAGTGHLGKRDCGECRGTGLVKVPYGSLGQRLLDHLQACTGQAAQDLSEGTRGLRRSEGNLEARAKHRGEASQAQRRRNDTEAAADAEGDTVVVAQKFRDSMGSMRRKT